MTTIQFLAEWALRSSILILSGALLLWAMRVRDSSVRLATWTAMLCASLAIPMLTMTLPKLPLPTMHAEVRPPEVPVVALDNNLALTPLTAAPPPVSNNGRASVFDLAGAAVIVYVSIAIALLLRVCVGLVLSLRLLRMSRTTDRVTFGIEILESDRVAAPLTLGIVRPVILLPVGWREWNTAKLDAVLAHERSHIRRYDPAVQLLSAVHRALLWHSPLSWFLHNRIVRVAEEASDDAALAVARDRASYAEVVLDFMQQGVFRPRVRTPNWLGVPMARYGRADDRIQRILDGTALSRGITRFSVLAILALGSPLVYVVATAHPQSAAWVQAATAAVPAVQAATAAVPAVQAVAESPAIQASPEAANVVPTVAQRASHSAAIAQGESAPVYLYGLGNVVAASVTVKPVVDGQLISTDFKEGEMVQAGQVVASIDPRPYEIQLSRVEEQLRGDQAQLATATEQVRGGTQPVTIVQTAETNVRADQANVERAKFQLASAKITAPITGIAGLRLVEPGNSVNASGSVGIVNINQVQPIFVVFTLPGDVLPQIRAVIGRNPPVEAWNRDRTVKIATGRLTAIDNQIDKETGAVKLKAVFDNKDGALFPNQFVNVLLIMNGK